MTALEEETEPPSAILVATCHTAGCPADGVPCVGTYYANAEPPDLRALFIEHAPAGIDVGDVWLEWFERADTTDPDIEQVVNGRNSRARRWLGSTTRVL